MSYLAQVGLALTRLGNALLGAVNHCRLAYLSDRNKAPLPTIRGKD